MWALPLQELLELAGARSSALTVRNGWGLSRFAEAPMRQWTAGAEVVVLALSGNRMLTDERRLREQLATLHAAIEAKHVVWLGPTRVLDLEVDRPRARAAELQRAVVRERRWQFVDLRSASRQGHRADGVHFTRDGYRRLTRAAWFEMNRLRLRPWASRSGVLVVGSAALLIDRLGRRLAAHSRRLVREGHRRAGQGRAG